MKFFNDILTETIDESVYSEEMNESILKLIQPIVKTNSLINSDSLNQEMKKMFPKSSSMMKEMMENYQLEYNTLIENFCTVATDNKLF